MSNYVCNICGYIYNETIGCPEDNLPAGTNWSDVPEHWLCPVCKAPKSDFSVPKDSIPQPIQISSPKAANEKLRELNEVELEALCINLSKGCEKQYLTRESELFRELAAYFHHYTSPVSQNQISDLLPLIEEDLSKNYPAAFQQAEQAHDRGTLRALTWSEKVTRILFSLLNRYSNQGNDLILHTNIYVCEICGFIYLGDSPPDICPICKVPKEKIALVARGVD